MIFNHKECTQPYNTYDQYLHYPELPNYLRPQRLQNLHRTRLVFRHCHHHRLRHLEFHHHRSRCPMIRCKDVHQYHHCQSHCHPPNLVFRRHQYRGHRHLVFHHYRDRLNLTPQDSLFITNAITKCNKNQFNIFVESIQHLD